MGRDANPYLAARREFGTVFGDLAKGKRNWQLACFGLLVLHGTLLAGYVRLAGEARITPYVVEVDRLGQAVAFGPAEALKKSDARMIVFLLALLVRNLRTVTSDFEAQKELLYGAYAYVSGSARATLDDYFLQPINDPRVLGRSVSRQVQVTAVLRVPNSESWKVAWSEIERPRFAGATRRTSWEAYLQVKTSPPTTSAAILANPLGIYVTEINWTQVSTGETR
ncbi:MAG TPA: VirB8/TrbF family protein [Thermoanaerobaculia bacterium]|nr:VirB8/TrbF family protein [Thermoanaerobaculia bacterium]